MCHFLRGPCLIKGESVGLCIPLSLLGNNSVKTFPRQRRIGGGVVFYAVGVVWKESRRFVLPKTSFLIYDSLIIPSFDAILSELLKVPLNKLQANRIEWQQAFIYLICWSSSSCSVQHLLAVINMVNRSWREQIRAHFCIPTCSLFSTIDSVSAASDDVTLSEFVRRMNSLRKTYIKVSLYLVLQFFRRKSLWL
jgi:hypothetical protein